MGDGPPGAEAGAGDVEAAVEKALRILNAASQTRAELGRKLERAGYLMSAVAVACDRVEAIGYLNDRAHAEAILRRRQRQGRGVKVIAAELRHKGLEAELVDEVLGEIRVDDEVERAAELCSTLLRRHADEPWARRRAKVMAALLRRGYTPWVARKALGKPSE